MNSVPERVILGCDVSKDWLDLHVYGQDGVCRIDNARTAIDAFDHSPDAWHPLMVFRAYLNPLSEDDVRYVPVASAADAAGAPARIRDPGSFFLNPLH